MEKLQSAIKWYLQTAMLIGVPVLFIVLMLGTQKMLFTATCYTAGFRCEYAFGATDAMTSFMSDLVGANPNVDIVAVPKNKR